MTRSEFAPIWAYLLTCWPTAKIADGTELVWADELAPFDATEVAAAARELARRATWFPSLAELWQAALARRDDPPTWERAWAEAEGHASGTAEPWSHPAVQETARAIGLYEIRATTNPSAVRAQFRDSYQAAIGRRQRDYAAGARVLPAPGTLPALPAPPPGNVRRLPIRARES